MFPTSFSSEAALSTRARRSAAVGAALAFARDARASSHSSSAARAAERLVGECFRVIEVTASRLTGGARLEGLREDHGIAELTRDGLRFGRGRALHGRASSGQRHQLLLIQAPTRSLACASAPGRLSARSIQSTASVRRYRIGQYVPSAFVRSGTSTRRPVCPTRPTCGGPTTSRTSTSGTRRRSAG
jgi:hypothetical protein